MATFGKVFSRNFRTSAKLGAGGASAHNENAAKAAVMWRNVTFFVCLPAVLVGSINNYLQASKHHPERPEFLNYEYMRIRRSKFPWGDGNHTLFHNKEVNALPGIGYEE